MSDEELLKHFDNRPEFRDARADWADEQTTLFCKLVRVIHSAGLDWWHAGVERINVRCGRTDPDRSRAVGVLAKVALKKQAPRIRFQLRFPVGNIPR